MKARGFFLLLLLVSPAAGQAPPADPSLLTLNRIFSSPEFHGERVPQSKWMSGNTTVSLMPSKESKTGFDVVQVKLSGEKTVLIPAEKLMLPGTNNPISIQGYEFSNDLEVILIYTNSAKVWRQNTRGDYWTFSRKSGKLSKIGATAKPSTLMFAKLSPDGKKVGYVCENNIFVEPVDGGPATKLTQDGSHEIINGTFDWVYEEEFDCRDGWRWSPDSQHISYWQLDTHGMKSFTLIDQTTGSYPILNSFPYPKTGEQNAGCRIGVVSSTGGDTTWMKIPGEMKTEYYLPRMEWAGNKEIVVQRLNRLQNSIDVMLADIATAQARIILTDRDNAWVDLHNEAMKWIDNGRQFTWISERDGWRHLYVASRDESVQRLVTPGEYDVIQVLQVNEKANRVYFIASPENPTQHYLYHVPLNGGGKAQRITPDDQPGWHDYQISAEGDIAIHTYSRFGVPPRTELISLPDHKVFQILAGNQKLRDVVDHLAKTPEEFFRVTGASGVPLDGWMMKPANFDPAKKYPMLIHVYGEPAGQTVVDRWGGSQYLWHKMLTQQGFIVACIDNRGTPCPKGRDWRKAVYRKIGTIASQDQAAAVRELLKRPYIDATRIGVWGWSGGGSMTLNLMFREPELYRTGISVAPVPDMRLYDTIYQERYMGLPQENADDYKNGSPITYASGLKGNLLIVHGTGDDNCHYQGVEKLVNKLIELNKPFEMMAYPNRSHSISEGRNTTRHLYGLMTRYLHDHLMNPVK